MGLGGDSNNLTFGGPQRDIVYMTRGSDVLLVAKGVAGFLGHPGAAAYKVLRYLDPPATL